MQSDYTYNIRVTGVLVENGELLLVRQKYNNTREWSLPGGRAENGESLEDAIIREMQEETGLLTQCVKLLYLCEIPDAQPSLIHISFLMKRIGGEIVFPDNTRDANNISCVRFVPIADLAKYGFSEKFARLVAEGFPGAGSYMGAKANIGL
ncbi:MAG: NUDIX hydrolase [Defluviitaleaceae bacterium]|nr:NUDIX hydrolase [Defluviitaleaceae bacterium]